MGQLPAALSVMLCAAVALPAVGRGRGAVSDDRLIAMLVDRAGSEGIQLLRTRERDAAAFRTKHASLL